MTEEWGARAEDLAVQIIGPLICGGAMTLQRPFGADMGLRIGADRRIVDNDLRTRIDTTRLRVARTVVATDVIHELSHEEWALAGAFNDLLQVTNHELSSFATRSRHTDLLDSVRELCLLIAPCNTLEAAVERHATFSRALQVARTDTELTWWTGSESFRGQTPPPRLLAWPGLRNVRVQENAVSLAAMAPGSAVAEDDYLDTLGVWMSCSPLSDIASSFREAPVFRWSTHTVSLIATVAGCNLALRALSHATNDDPVAAKAAVAAMQQSASALNDGAGKAIATQFAGWLEQAKTHWAETG